jgi:acyl-CoA reductase-like NAD-dependent aldehyde dehydrogenase
MTTAAATPHDVTVDPPMIVGGAAVEAASGERYAVRNPANGRPVGSAPSSGPEDARRAVESASAAASTWRATSVADRIVAIARGLDAVESKIDSLAILLTREQGKPLAESTTEIASFVERMRSFLRAASASADGIVPTLSGRGRADGWSVASPVTGVAVSLVAWNFPVGLLAKKLGPTLLGGGVLIVKPALTTPLTTLRVVELMNASLPPGVLSCVTGRGDCVGAALSTHPAVSRVYLTGSDQTGEALRRSAGTDGRELSLELAGSDPMIVCADADVPSAVQAAIAGRFRNAGQACIAVKRLYVAGEIADDFTRELVRAAQLREPGDGLEPARAPLVRLGPLHTAEQRDRVEQQLHDAVRQGADVLAGGDRPIDPALRSGHFFNATIVAGVPPGTKLVTEEVFGPVLPLFTTRSLDEAIAQANQSGWDLNAYIWTADKERARELRPRIKCRQLWVNRLSFGAGDLN